MEHGVWHDFDWSPSTTTRARAGSLTNWTLVRAGGALAAGASSAGGGVFSGEAACCWAGSPGGGAAGFVRGAALFCDVVPPDAGVPPDPGVPPDAGGADDDGGIGAGRGACA